MGQGMPKAQPSVSTEQPWAGFPPASCSIPQHLAVGPAVSLGCTNEESSVHGFMYVEVQASQGMRPQAQRDTECCPEARYPQDHLRALQPAALGTGHTNQQLGSHHRRQGWQPTRPGVALLSSPPTVPDSATKEGPNSSQSGYP